MISAGGIVFAPEGTFTIITSKNKKALARFIGLLKMQIGEDAWLSMLQGSNPNIPSIVITTSGYNKHIKPLISETLPLNLKRPLRL